MISLLNQIKRAWMPEQWAGSWKPSRQPRLCAGPGTARFQRNPHHQLGICFPDIAKVGAEVQGSSMICPGHVVPLSGAKTVQLTRSPGAEPVSGLTQRRLHAGSIPEGEAPAVHKHPRSRAHGADILLGYRQWGQGRKGKEGGGEKEGRRGRDG